MVCSTRCCVILVALVAVLAYFGLQKTTVSFEFSVSDIKSDPQTVFELFRDPKNLPTFNPLMNPDLQKVEIVSIEEKDRGVEVVNFTLPIFWKAWVSVTWSIDPSSLSIDSDVTDQFGILTLAHEKWMLAPDQSEEGSVRTVMTESTQFTVPRIFAFVAHIFKDAHLEMAQMVKRAAESRQKEQ